MGSLVSGWKSPSHDSKKLKFERNKSLTKEGIEAYWRAKKKDENELHQEVMKNIKEPEKKYQRSRSMPLTNTKRGSINLDDDVNLEILLQRKAWWTRGNSAFLNETPVISNE